MSKEKAAEFLDALRPELAELIGQAKTLSAQLSRVVSELQDKIDLARSFAAVYGLPSDCAMEFPLTDGRVMLPEAINSVLNPRTYMSTDKIVAEIKSKFALLVLSHVDRHTVATTLSRCRQKYGWRNRKQSGPGVCRDWRGTDGS